MKKFENPEAEALLRRAKDMTGPQRSAALLFLLGRMTVREPSQSMRIVCDLLQTALDDTMGETSRDG